jgi:predicted oxidoreductase
MQYQLRIYKIRPGLMVEFARKWRPTYAKARVDFGFKIEGAWVDEEAYEFIWLVSYAGPEGYAAADAAYYASPGRAAIAWDTSPYIEKMDLRLLDPVDAS